MKQTPPITYTKSKHPLVILKAVIKTILDEPKRYNQETFISIRDTIPDDRFPACDTIACVAGWTCLVAERDFRGMGGISQRATNLLRLTPETSGALFDGGALYQLSSGTGYGETTPRQYARLGVRHILRFATRTWGQAAADYLKGKTTRPPRITEVR